MYSNNTTHMSLAKDIKAHPDKYRKNQRDRCCSEKLIDEILDADSDRIKQNFTIEKCNQMKKQISILIGKIKKEQQQQKSLTQHTQTQDTKINTTLIQPTFTTSLEHLQNLKTTESNNVLSKLNEPTLIALSKHVDTEIKRITQIVAEDLHSKLLNRVPNTLHPSVPINKNEDNNTIILIKDQANKPTTKLPLNQVDLCAKLNIVDCERGSALAGNRGYFLTGLGVKLNMALMMYAADFLESRNYKQMYVPHFMNGNALKNLCQLEDYTETLYKLTGDGDPDKKEQEQEREQESNSKYLIATSEQPLTGYYTNHQFKPKDDLPVRFCGISTCYRKEAGKHGKDTAGIFRVHQFEKIEQLCITSPTSQTSDTMFQEMIKNATDFYDSLGISYRVVNIVSGALNNAAAIKYDLEGYFAGSGTYKELVSCSNCTDFFSRKLNIKDHEGNFVHILNATLCANTRTLCCIMEQYQTEKGIQVPKVLLPYMHNYKLDYIPFAT